MFYVLFMGALHYAPSRCPDSVSMNGGASWWWTERGRKKRPVARTEWNLKNESACGAAKPKKAFIVTWAPVLPFLHPKLRLGKHCLVEMLA